MGLLDGIRTLLSVEQLQTRTVLASAFTSESTTTFEELLSRLQPIRSQPWRRATSREAMGVPAVFKAVSLISNTIGTLSMEAYRNRTRLSEDDTPRLVVRPDPFNPPQVFWRDSADYKAQLGETWWWIAKRDSFDGSVLSLIALDPREITVDRNPKSLFRPIIKWLGQEMRNDDMVQMMYLRDPKNPLRGIGPLQACGAAVSVAVEAQEWAANWYAGNPATTWIKAGYDVDDTEAAAIKAKWMEDSTNLPKVTGPSIESVTDIGADPEKAQMSESRLFQNGEVALMFSMPPTLLNYAVSGSTITYQNVGQIADDLLRQCLLPHYLEPMEQAMSDLLPRTTVARFNVNGLLRSDIRTRFDIYAIGIDKGIFSPEYAAESEGILGGDIENRPVPAAPPSAIPIRATVETRGLTDLRCPGCGKLAGKVSGAAEIKCRGCGALAVA